MSVINWDNVNEQSRNFKNNQPTRWAFIENFVDSELYSDLYETYPRFDDTWQKQEGAIVEGVKLSYRKFWKRDEGRFYSDGTAREHDIIEEYDSRYSESWNKFLSYLWSEECIKKIVDFTGVEVTNLRHMNFMYARKDGFQRAHIHNASDKTLIVFVYFSKDWEKGDPGGTYLSDGLDESKIILEPCNLDNTALFVLDGPDAAHGQRKITKNVERRGIQLTFEPKTSKGWYSSPDKEAFEPLDLGT